MSSNDAAWDEAAYLPENLFTQDLMQTPNIPKLYFFREHSMERWQGKVAVVTGASAGIGSAVCVALADAGLTVVGLARRTHLIDKLQSEVNGSGRILSRQCDVGNSQAVAAAFHWIEGSVGCVHAVVNNAGVFHHGQITDVGDDPLSEEALLSTIDVNLTGPVLCTRHAVASMKRHGFDGHVITINSIAGHYVPFVPQFNVYPSTKHAITAFSRSLATELAQFKSLIKTTSISPGLVATEMAGDLTAKDGSRIPALDPKDVAEAVLYVLSTPPSVNIDELTITPVGGLRL